MILALLHCEHDHVVAVAAAYLDRLARVLRKLVHLLNRDIEQVERAGISQPIVIETRA